MPSTKVSTDFSALNTECSCFEKPKAKCVDEQNESNKSSTIRIFWPGAAETAS